MARPEAASVEHPTRLHRPVPHHRTRLDAEVQAPSSNEGVRREIVPRRRGNTVNGGTLDDEIHAGSERHARRASERAVSFRGIRTLRRRPAGTTGTSPAAARTEPRDAADTIASQAS